MSWSEPGFGFFGKGFWGRRVLWDNVPIQQRELDVHGHLEALLSAYGDELESHLAQIGLLPLQRDPYQVRAVSGQGEWFYVTQMMRWEDENWGNVFRLIGEPDSTVMPSEGHTELTFETVGYVACVPGDVGLPVLGANSRSNGVLLSYNNTTRTWVVSRNEAGDLFGRVELVSVVGGTGRGMTVGAAPSWCPWYPYAAISNVARWWKTSVPIVDDLTGAESITGYDVALVRTRNFDPASIYSATRSLGNEVWIQGGDLILPFMHPAGWIVSGNAVTDAPVGGGVVIGLGDGSPTPTVALPGPAQRLQPNVTDPVPPYTVAGARLILDLLDQALVPIRLCDAPDVGVVEVGHLYREDPMNPGELDLANPLGTVDYLSGNISIDLSPLGLFSLFDGPITAYWQALGYYLHFLPPKVMGFLARDYGFDSDENDPEDRQRAAIAHVHHYFGCKAAQESYRIRGEISLFNVEVMSLWRLCDAILAASLPSDHVYEYGGVFYTDLEPRSIRFDDIRGDEQYYDTFNHDPAFPSPVWLTLADRAMMFEDAAAGDGMSVGLAFGLDVTQGYHAPVSETDATWRTPATVIASTPLLPAEAAALSIPGGHRVNIDMMRCQADAFSFHRGAFGLTEYDKAGLVAPALADPVFWIDYEDAAWTMTVPVPGFPDQDMGRWTVIIGVGLDSTGSPLPGPTVGSDVAVRYYPEIDHGDCCFCPSYKVRVLIDPMPQAYDYYTTEDEMLAAVERLKSKILDKLIPIHVRVAEWIFTMEFTVLMGSVQTGWVDTRVMDPDEWVDMGPSSQILLTVEQRGDLNAMAKWQRLRIFDGGGVALVDTGAVRSGFADPDTWYPVAGWTGTDVTAALDGEINTEMVADSSAVVTYGDVRCTFRVARGTLG